MEDKGSDIKPFRVASLGSGSKGNATLIQYQETTIMIDSGFSCKTLESKLALRGVKPEQVDAILVTHEHGDHFNGVPTFSNRYKIPVWMSRGTSFHPKAEKIKLLNCFNSQFPFSIKSLEISPVLVPHDAREACQFVVHAKDKSIGLLTDLGHITPYVESKYRDCDVLLLEFNHDINLLEGGQYPVSLKKRVGGELGHLNNHQAKALIEKLNLEKLRYLVAMHLSEENNDASIVLDTINRASFADKFETQIAHQESGFDWITV
ncbi:MBL fold metallo-hydrolase [Aliikangiella sp. IMCC44653]